jgi:hypothetical protein
MRQPSIPQFRADGSAAVCSWQPIPLPLWLPTFVLYIVGTLANLSLPCNAMTKQGTMSIEKSCVSPNVMTIQPQPEVKG